MSLFENDRKLLEQFRRGERSALARVYEHYVDNVAVLVRRGFTMESQGHVYVAGAPDVDTQHELIQETFVKAFSEPARMSFDGLRPYRPFLLRITKNLMLDRFRAQRRDRARRVEDGGVGDIDALLAANSALVDAGACPDDLDWQRLSAATKEFLDQLDTESRAVVRLRFEEEMSQDAAAERLVCTRRRVRTIEQRVQTALRRHLRARGLLPDPS